MRLVPFALAVTLVFHLQAWLGRIAPLPVDVGPAFAVFLGLFARREAVGWGCLVLGVMRGALDVGAMGVWILVYLVLALAVAWLRGSVFGERLATQWILTFFAALLYLVLLALAAWFFPVVGPEGLAGMLRTTVAVLCGTVVAPGLFTLLRVLRAAP